METRELQKEIKCIIKKMGWSQKRLAREIYMEENDVDNEDEIVKFEEKVKKELNRPSTKTARLKHYLDIIALAPEFKGIDIVLRDYHGSGILGTELEAQMKKISIELDKMLLN